ncbi:MAG: SDR family oxidoreductase [Leptospira sp.]|nr:SDR family oxidoreductase [Leptospira sp.]
MSQTIIITGASSGIGKATAELFAERQWQVFSFSRKPGVHNHPNIQNLVVDISNPDSIQTAIQTVYKRVGRLDAIVNNAGFGAFGAFETSKHEERMSMFQINVFGLMNVIQKSLPYLRQQKFGTIVNVSSIGGLITYPLFSVYHSTKWAVEGFSESLHFELKPFGIKVKIIEPGATKSKFNSESMQEYKSQEIVEYADYVSKLQETKDKSFEDAIAPEEVALVIWDAVTGSSEKLRYVVGNRRSKTLAKLRKILPTPWFLSFLEKRLNLK